MKTTIFVFHPNLEDGSNVNNALAKVAQVAGYKVRDMYKIYPNFQIDIPKEQEILEQSDRIILQFPMYWYSAPALMREWLDRVLEYGWAYGSKGKALVDKEIILAVTQGAKAEDYTSEGRFHITNEELLKPFETIKYHTGLNFLDTFIVSGTASLTEEEIKTASKNYLVHLEKEYN